MVHARGRHMGGWHNISQTFVSSEGVWCSEKQAGSQKSCLPLKKMAENLTVEFILML